MGGVGLWDESGFSCVDWDGQLRILLGMGDRGWSRSMACVGSLELMGRRGLAAWAAWDQRSCMCSVAWIRRRWAGGAAHWIGCLGSGLVIIGGGGLSGWSRSGGLL